MSTETTGTHGAATDRPAWLPTSQQSEPPPGPAGGDGAALRGLRATAYVLTSLASLLFIALVIYGGVQVYRIQSVLGQFGNGLTGLTGSSAPDAPTGDLGKVEYPPPTVPGVGEDDYVGMRENIVRNGGQPSSSAEAQYLYACDMGVLPAADCP